MLGHELRNPLAPIATALELMKLRNHGEATREQQVIERQVGHVMRLVDDLLDVSRIVEGKVELRRQRLDLREVLAKAIEIASPVLEQKQHRLAIDLAPGTMPVEGDEGRLTQVFANLIVNAAKYTDPEGRIEIVGTSEGDRVTIEVRDTGVGMDATLLPRVFDLFVQGYQGVDRSRGGLGLGLALVRTLVAKHGGSVEARSEGIGRGSTFVVSLPRCESTPVAVPKPRKRPIVTNGDVRRVLVVDDNEDAALLLAEALSAAGHDVRTALDPPQALEVARTFHPEVAVLDIGLPVMDGYELAERLRSELGDATPRLIALTGYGQASDRERSARAGFSAHFVKPIDVQRLTDTIARP
jgi:CheY-like chemotaxis protein/two-component sensor histidine kinase